MFPQVIYEKTFPPDPILQEITNRKKPDNPDASQEKFTSLDALLMDAAINTKYIPISRKIRNCKKFVNAAIDLSEFYGLDVKITQFTGHISATFYFDVGPGIRKTNKLMAMADEFDFAANLHGHNIAMTLNYYTHKIVRRGIVWAP